MDRQAIFDAGYKGVIAQGRPSLKGGMCMYRGQGDTKCALGHSIPDEKYEERFENNAPGFSIFDKGGPAATLANIFGAQNEADIKFLRAFQRCHDRADEDTRFVDERRFKANADEETGFVERFKAHAVRFAKREGLNVPDA